ncbi:TMEM175 family protein [Pediococcus argentinicus]|uniref:Integral membrane protein n=1 Tax=Pediococcus argentinicus TaxID=480391 RepID=A0A0R2NLG1_9LACO|nr:TMEM175 family protein [Pediococcus argentinicus]KRO24627.1 hypothetical protein IV88_GL000830 [Pediococcus argentinicus]NKZ22797.1 DUF1211 domain-containing protein [Pediococcus argentinicus]GEP19863.1 membrane protein [Pediococcus argentinicus]
MNKGRVEAFIDAIIAIVLTVLILEIKVPDRPSLTAFFGEWRMAFSYLMTFILVMFSWYVQHEVFVLIKRVKLGGFIGICIWLFILSFLPLTTAFEGRFPSYWGADLIYLAMNWIWLISARLMGYLLIRDNPDAKGLSSLSTRQGGVFMLVANTVWCFFAAALAFYMPFLGILTPIVTVIIQVISNYLHRNQIKAANS